MFYRFRVVIVPLVVACLWVVAGSPVLGDDDDDRLTLQTVRGAPSPGEQREVTVVGDVAGIQTLWVDAADVTVEPALRDEQPGNGRATFAVTLPADAAVGIVAVRAVGERGMSGPLLLMIDDLPSTTRQGNIDTPARAQSLEPPVAVDTHMQDNRLHHYRFSARAGERVVMDVVAQRMGSQLDPLMRLLDERGNVLATADDEVGLGADCRISHVFEAEGEYIIELRDTLYEGGRGSRYRLRVGNLPTATTAVPLSVAAGEVTDVRLVGGVDGDDEALPPYRVEAAATDRRLRVSARAEEHDGSAYAAVLVDDRPHVYPDPPGGDAEKATAVEAGAIIVAGFDAANEAHYYRVNADEGQRIAFVFESESVHGRANVLPRLFDAEGRRIAQPDDPGWPEITLAHTFEAEGVYHLQVDELHYAAGPAHVYRLAIEENPPRFSLGAATDTLHVTQGESVSLTINADRDGYEGPISMEAGLKTDLSLELDNARLSDEAEETELVVTVPRDAEAALHFVRFVGMAAADGADDTAAVSTRPALDSHWPRLRHPPAELDGLIALYIHPAPEPEQDDADEEAEDEAPADEEDDEEQAEDDA